MRVSRIIDKAAWEESHRGREWLSPKQAIKRVKQAELEPMIEKLVKQLAAELA
jgi:hypothetical protein